MANQVVTLYGDQVIGSANSWNWNVSESAGGGTFGSGSSGIFFDVGVASSQNGVAIGNPAVSLPNTQTSVWATDMPQEVKYVFVPADPTGLANAQFTICGFTDNWTGASISNTKYNYFTPGAVMDTGATVPTYRQVRSVAVNAVFGTNAIAADGGFVAPIVIFGVGGVGSDWGHNVPGLDNVSSYLIGDVTLGATAGISTGGYVGTQWTQYGAVNPATWGTAQELNANTGFLNLAPFTLAEIAGLALSISVYGNGAGVPSAELRIQSMALQISYNDPPQVQRIGVTNQLAPGGAIETTIPQITWQYADPENDAQEGYRVLVFTAAQVNSTGFPSVIDLNDVIDENPLTGVTNVSFLDTGFETGFQAVWDSQAVQGGGSSATIPPGYLLNTQKYRVFVFLTDVGSNFRYNTCANYGNESILLTTALTTGGAITTLHTAGGLTTAIPAGANIIITDPTGAHTQTFVAPTGAAASATSITVTSETPNFAYPTTSTLSVENSGIDLVVAIEPVLMPAVEFVNTPNSPSSSFNPLTGAIGPITVAGRFNLLPQVDADCLSSGTASVGTWALNNTFFTNGSGATVSTATVNGIVITQISASGTATGVTFCMATAPVSVSPGMMLTGEFKYYAATSGVQVGVAFFSDTLGTVTTGIGSTNNPAVSPAGPIAVDTGGALPVKAFVQTRVPADAITARLFFITQNATKGGPNYYGFTQAALTVGTTNIVDDSSFEQPSATTLDFWTASTDSSFPSVPSSPPSWPFSQIDAQLGNGSAAGSVASASKFLLGIDADLNFLYRFDGIGVDTVAFVCGSNSTNFTTTASWATYTGSFAGANFSSGVGTSTTAGTVGLSSASTTATPNVDNVSIEMVWPFVPVPLTITGTGTLGSVPTFGYDVGSNIATGQNWFCENRVGGPPAIENGIGDVSPHSAISVTQGSGSGQVTTVEQFFTVSGYTAISLGWNWLNWHTTMQSFLQFYDNAGIELSQSAIVGLFDSPNQVGSTYLPVTSGSTPSGFGGFVTATGAVNPIANLPVPVNAAYARWSFVVTQDGTAHQGVGYICSTTMTPTGSLAPSSPWRDGGWSAGGLTQDVALFGSPLTLNLSRSPTPFVTPTPFLVTPAGAGFVRVPPNTAQSGGAASVSANYQQQFIDYEYPAVDLFSPQSISYLASVVAPDGQLVPPSQMNTITNSQSFTPSSWLLIDPLFPSQNIILQVKKVSFTTDENQSVLMPAGRGYKVVIGDTQIFGDTITLDLQTLSQGDFDNLKVQYSKVYPLLLRSSEGEMWYVRLTKRTRERVWNGTHLVPHRTYSITMESVNTVV